MRRGVRPRLKHLNASGRFPSGNIRYYYRPKGQKGVSLPDLPPDHPKFLAAYAKAAGVTPRAPVMEGSLASAIALYKASDAFGVLAPGTRAARRPMLDSVADSYGHASRRNLARRHIEKDLSRFQGHARNNRLKMWRGFCSWLVDHDHLIADPSDGIRRSRTPKTNGHRPWTDEEIADFRRYWDIGTIERLAFELIFWTGARVSDAVRLGDGCIDRDGWLQFRQQKTGGQVSIPFKRKLPRFAQASEIDLKLLWKCINARPDRHMTYLHTQQGRSRSSKSVSQWFSAKAREAGLEGRTAHGLRKSRAKTLAEAGAAAHQIGAWTGHESLREIERYIRDFNKKKALSWTEEEQKSSNFYDQVPKAATK